MKVLIEVSFHDGMASPEMIAETVSNDHGIRVRLAGDRDRSLALAIEALLRDKPDVARDIEEGKL